MMFHDHHFHPMGYAQMKTGLELMDSADLDQVKARVSARAEQTSGAIIGQRLNDEGLAELRLPTRTDLDEAVPDRPVVLYRYCGHIAVANSEALRLAGIDATTPDPPGGSFDRDRTGFPTGVLQGNRPVGDRKRDCPTRRGPFRCGRSRGIAGPARLRPRLGHRDGLDRPTRFGAGSVTSWRPCVVLRPISPSTSMST